MPQASGENRCGGRGGSPDGRGLALAVCVSASGWRGPCTAGDVTAADAGCGCRARNMDRLTERAGCERSDRPQAGVCQAGRTFRTLAVRPARYRGK